MRTALGFDPSGNLRWSIDMGPSWERTARSSAGSKAAGALPSLGVRWCDVVGEKEIEAVGDRQHPRRRPGHIGDAVLPDDGVGGRIDGHHAVPVVVIYHDQSVRESLRQ